MRRYNQTQVFQFQTSKLKCLYFFHFVKEQYSLPVKKPEPNVKHNRLALHSRRIIHCLANAPVGGGERDRTDDLLLAKQALSQLSYTPDKWWVWMDLNHRPHAYQACALTN
jgi:hypothetical protein